LSNIVQIPIPDSLKKLAEAKSRQVGELRNSITNGAGNVAGAIGEMVVAAYTGARIDDEYEYDLMLPDGSRVDVKTKRTTVPPDPSFECSIAAFNTSQLTDAYCFVRVMNGLSAAYILGWISKRDYFDRATFRREGDVDPDNNFVFKADCYNLRVSDLHPIQHHKRSAAA
jgi:hypothetical protein